MRTASFSRKATGMNTCAKSRRNSLGMCTYDLLDLKLPRMNTYQKVIGTVRFNHDEVSRAPSRFPRAAPGAGAAVLLLCGTANLGCAFYLARAASTPCG